VIDKRITPRFMRYRRADLWIGILLVIIGAVAMMAVAAATFADRGRAKLNGINPQGTVKLKRYTGDWVQMELGLMPQWSRYAIALPLLIGRCEASTGRRDGAAG